MPEGSDNEVNIPKGVSRRVIITKGPVAAAGGLYTMKTLIEGLAVSTAVSLLTAACDPAGTTGSENQPKTDLEKKIYPTINFFLDASNRNFNKESALTLATGASYTGDLELKKYNGIKSLCRYQGQFANPNVLAILTALTSVSKSAHSNKEIHDAYEDRITPTWDIKDHGQASLVSLGLIYGDQKLATTTFNDIKKKLFGFFYDQDAVIILTSLAMMNIKDTDIIVNTYKTIKEKTPGVDGYKVAILTLAAVLSNQSPSSIIETYDSIVPYRKWLFFGNDPYDWQVALVFASVLKHGNIDEVTQMFDYAKKFYGVTDQIAAALVLTVVTHEILPDYSIVTTLSRYTDSDDNTYYQIIPLIFKQPQTTQ
jgi:hypothetical protein